MKRDTLEAIFYSLKGLPAWSVRRVHGSFISLNFRNPRLLIIEPKSISKRRIFVVGDFHWSVCSCLWQISRNSKVIANQDTDPEEIVNACDYLDGQILTKIDISHNPISIEVGFDLGGSFLLEVDKDSGDDQWIIYDGDRQTITLDRNGQLVSTSGDRWA